MKAKHINFLKTKKRKKKSSKTKLKEKAWVAVREAIFVRDNYTCQHCFKDVKGSDCQPSHVLSKAAFPWLEYDMINVKTLCYRCHFHFWHKNPLLASEWFTKEFPLRMEYLNEQRKNQHKLSEEEVAECLQKAQTYLESKRSSL